MAAEGQAARRGVAQMFGGPALPPAVDVSDFTPSPDSVPAVPLRPGTPAPSEDEQNLARLGRMAAQSGFPSRERGQRRPRMTIRFEAADEQALKDMRVEALREGIEASLNDVVTAAVRLMREMPGGKRLEFLRAVASKREG